MKGISWFRDIKQRLSVIENKISFRSGYTLRYRECKYCKRRTLQMQINNNEVYDCCICGKRWVNEDVEVKISN